MARDVTPHPRDRHILVGQDAAVQSLVAAVASGRLHHAWLIGGPIGIGKATLAYRFTRRMLAGPSERREDDDGLGVDPDGRTSRLVSSGAHRNLLVIERALAEGDKPAPKTIGVDAVRRAQSFFSSTAADGGPRICIVDSVDDLTPAAANALLKTIEEPPRGGLILLVSHAPHSVLPTMRSRCRKLALSPLPADAVERVLGSLGEWSDDQDPESVGRAARLADGSVARAIALSEPTRLAVLTEVMAVLDALPRAPIGRILALADRLADRRRDDALPLALDAVERWLAARVRAGQDLGAARLAPLVAIWESVVDAAETVETYNLDRRAFIVSIFGDLAEAVRRAA